MKEQHKIITGHRFEARSDLGHRKAGKRVLAVLLFSITGLCALNASATDPSPSSVTGSTPSIVISPTVPNGLRLALYTSLQTSNSEEKVYRSNNTNSWLQQAKLLASGGATSGAFGWSVSVSGDTALIGAYGDSTLGAASGSAYVFVRNPVTGAWSEQAKLQANDGSSGDVFGRSVALNGDTALIGASIHQDLGPQSGAAYVFVRNPATGAWSQQAKLLANDGTVGDVFGFSVAIDSDIALIGAKGGSNSRGTGTGTAYVFARNSATGAWSQQAKLLASDGAYGDFFGGSVALSGDTALIGASEDNVNTGSAYVFVQNPANGVWSEQAKLLGYGVINEYFGWSVAVSGDTALIGGFGRGANTGAAYVFVRNPATTNWSQQATLLANDGTTGDAFGYAVAIDGDTSLIGAINDDGLGTKSGTSYIFVRNPATGSWFQQPKLQASDGLSSAAFGGSVSISGRIALIGARNDSTFGLGTGSAYVFEGPVVLYKDDIVIDFGSIGLWARMNDTSWQKLNNSSPDDVITGDVDGNGVDDVIADFGSTFGGIFIKRNGGGWTKLHNSSPQSMATGDLDGNGKDDIIIDFGGIGLWARMNDSSWTKLNNSSPDQFVITDMDGNGADDVIADFGSTFGGLFVKRNLGGWSKMHNTSPVTMATGDIDGNGSGDVIINFGGIGLWARMNNASWTKLHNGSPDRIVSGDVDGNGADDVIATFGSTTGGVWQKLNLGGWSKLNNNAPDQMVMGDMDANGQSDLIGAFNSTLGGIFVRRNNGSWQKLHNSNPDDLAVGGLDGL